MTSDRHCGSSINAVQMTERDERTTEGVEGCGTPEVIVLRDACPLEVFVEGLMGRHVSEHSTTNQPISVVLSEELGCL